MLSYDFTVHYVPRSFCSGIHSRDKLEQKIVQEQYPWRKKIRNKLKQKNCLGIASLYRKKKYTKKLFRNSIPGGKKSGINLNKKNCLGIASLYRKKNYTREKLTLPANFVFQLQQTLSLPHQRHQQHLQLVQTLLLEHSVLGYIPVKLSSGNNWNKKKQEAMPEKKIFLIGSVS